LQELVSDARRAASKEAAALLEPLIADVEGRAAGFFSALEERTGLLGSVRRGDSVVRLRAEAAEATAREQEELLAALETLGEATSDDPEPELQAIARRCQTLADELHFVT